jgi:hypothetical protein
MPAPADEGHVTIFARPTAPSRRGAPSLVAVCTAAARRLILAACLFALPAAFMLSATSAQAVVAKVGPIAVGLQPRVQEHYQFRGLALEENPFTNYLVGAEPAEYANPSGNPVLHSSNTWAIYWDGAKNNFYHGDWMSLIDGYFAGAAQSSGSLASIFSVDAQYTDKSNQPASYKQSFRGSAEDTSSYPASECTDPAPLPTEELESKRVPPTTCLTSEQVAKHLEGYIKEHNLPTGLGNIYYLFTPPGVTVCLDGGGATGHCSDYAGTDESYANSFCSYHADINPSGLSTGSSSTIVYGVIPWTAGTFKDPDFPSAQTAGWECQDGSYNPASKPSEQIEKERVLSAKEEEEYKAKNAKEKAEENEAHILEGPHEQEPNQQTCPTSDGGCDYGLADLIINQVSLEQQNIVTDPLLNGWKDPDGYENTDECRFQFSPILGGSASANSETDAGSLYNQTLGGTDYYLNSAFNFAGELLNYPGVPCLMGTSLDPKFTAPSPVNTDEVVAFNGTESDIALNAGIAYSPSGTPEANYATYTWNFGDGTPTVTGYAPGSPPCEAPWLTPCAGSVFHSYEYGGAYEVTLTVRDVAGDTTDVSHIINVSGPPRPGASGNAGNTGGAGGPGAGAGAHGGLLAPIAAELIVPQSLRTALRKGLVVSYSVNEQVAGHFEVLLSRALARKLHISGPLATGLAKSSPPQIVIAKAILVTTKGGHSALHIQFSKQTAARLAHVHKIPLMVRLVVRNAGASTTTVLTSATLTA